MAARRASVAADPRLELLRTGPRTARATLVFAHGAGASMDAPFLTVLADALAEHDVGVVRFEFAYMARRRADGVRRPPERMPALVARFHAALERVAAECPTPPWIGGKSLGGRVATHVAVEARCAGVICAGYPFHPPRAPARLRIEHLPRLTVPTLILQGERDPFGTPDEVAGLELGRSTTLVRIPDGDHSFDVPKRSARSTAQNLALAAATIAAFVTRSPDA